VRAVVYDRYGPPEVLRLEDVERPTPAENEILVRVHATTVNRTDCGWRSAKPFLVRFFIGVRRPKQRILGMELAGEVEAVDAAVTEFAVGDRVFGVKGFGAHAELVCIRESGPIAHMPDGMSFEEAAAVCDGVCITLSCLRKAELGPGRSILVYGASGSVGTAAVQLAKHFGANVTAVCDTKTLELVRSLGADRVIDYTQEDFTRNGEMYDVVFDAVGKHTFMRCRRSLKPRGIYIATDGFRNFFVMPWVARLTGKRVTLGIAKYRKQDIVFLKTLLDAGAYRPVIDRSYPLQDVVEATTYVETGMKTGNVVLTVNASAAR
jgi:NADPH:quinone reductase-like Zn-dependent oxidoreductase